MHHRKCVHRPECNLHKCPRQLSLYIQKLSTRLYEWSNTQKVSHSKDLVCYHFRIDSWINNSWVISDYLLIEIQFQNKIIEFQPLQTHFIDMRPWRHGVLSTTSFDYIPLHNAGFANVFATNRQSTFHIQRTELVWEHRFRHENLKYTSAWQRSTC